MKTSPAKNLYPLFFFSMGKDAVIPGCAGFDLVLVQPRRFVVVVVVGAIFQFTLFIYLLICRN